jgi:hypothetical protein
MEAITMDQPIEPGGNALIERAKAILLKPAETWPTIAAEPGDTGNLITRYAVPLAAIGPVAGFLGGQLFGYGAFGFKYTPGLMEGLKGAIMQFVMALVGVIVLAFVADFLAPKFGGESNRGSAFKLVIYSMTAAWLAGIFGLVPLLGILGVAGLYSLYLLYTGATPLMKVPQDKAVGFTAVTVLAAVVLYLVIGAVSTAVLGVGAGAAAIAGGGSSAGSGMSGGEVTIPGIGKIDTGKMEEAAKRMEQASKGEVKPVALADLQALLPASLGSYARTAVESTGAGAIGSQAEGTYKSGDKTIRLKIIDMSALGALAGMGAALGVEQNREDADGYERTGTVDGAMQSESWNRSGNRGKFGRMFGNRFMVEAEGEADSVGELKSAVAAVDQDRLSGLAE